jgi:hypothetical protein
MQAEDAALRGCTEVRVDQRRCTYMDSTFIGTLLLLHRRLMYAGALALICPSPACQKLLGDLCLERVLISEDSEELPETAWLDLPSHAEVTRPFASSILEAHVALAELTAPTGAPFQGVVQCLARDIELS